MHTAGVAHSSLCITQGVYGRNSVGGIFGRSSDTAAGVPVAFSVHVYDWPSSAPTLCMLSLWLWRAKKRLAVTKCLGVET